MDTFAAARAAARHWRAQALRECGGEASTSALIQAALRLAGLTACPVDDDDSCLCGAEAVLDRATGAIFYKASAAQALALFEIAHELGHFWMEGESTLCDSSGLDLSDDDTSPYGLQRIDGYGPKQHRECQANVFARTFLLPEAVARECYLAGATPSDIAAQYCLEERLVVEQLLRGTLLPDGSDQIQSEPAPRVTDLDDSQRRAAEIIQGPLLLEAGPGTGKTRTLVARVEYLLAQNVDPKNILILTFSRKAAEELRERVGHASPAAATQIWAGTFHALGLDLLRRFGDRIGLDQNLSPLDPNDGIALLEELLPDLPLDQYLALHEPVQVLGDILGAISRAKDELVDPAGYRALGEAMPQQSREDVVARSKVIEIAEIYARYQAALAQRRTVDFGDLIMRSCQLLEHATDVRDQLRAEYAHILVDEFQDVNRASAILVRHLAGSGAGLWAVGDARQSIYRFRGASPENLSGFDTDYPAAVRLALSVNYRSSPQIVQALAAFGTRMQAGIASCAWEASSARTSRIQFDVAATLDDEAKGIAAAVRHRHRSGIGYRDQAILCRSHTMLARYAQALEARGIPVLYLGDVFERPEIRDLLSLLSLIGETGSSGLIRLCRGADYPVALAELSTLLAHARDGGLSQLELVAQSTDQDLSPEAATAFAALRADTACLSPHASASSVLLRYLFARRRLPLELVAGRSVVAAQKRLAIYQLLRAAASYAQREPKAGVKGFLDWVRRLELFGEERQLRTPPAEAGGIDAVRLMTVHASKGLEFEVVHLPALATSYFPSSGRYDPCPPPPGLVTRSRDAIRTEEEECLFFVALSRAKAHLHLSRAINYGITRKASPFLSFLAAHLPRPPDASPNWRISADLVAPPAPIAACATRHEVHAAEDLDQFLRCPQAYLYQRILGLNGGRSDNGYVRFHRAVYAVLRQLAEFRDKPDPREAAGTALDIAWARIGPSGHAFERLYRRQADLLLDRAIAAYLHSETEDLEWIIPLAGAGVRVRPEFAIKAAGRLTLRRLRTGRAPKASPDDDIYALYYAGAQQNGRNATVDTHFLGCDTIAAVPMTDRVIANRLEKYRKAIDDIARGAFPAAPSDRVCPRCPQYFVCGSGTL